MKPKGPSEALKGLKGPKGLFILKRPYKAPYKALKGLILLRGFQPLEPGHLFNASATVCFFDLSRTQAPVLKNY